LTVDRERAVKSVPNITQQPSIGHAADSLYLPRRASLGFEKFLAVPHVFHRQHTTLQNLVDDGPHGHQA
jgi:hypothetical protein